MISDLYYGMGAFLAVLATGIITDLFLRNKNFILIFILNFVLFLCDVYLFLTVNEKEGKALTNVFSGSLGAILASADVTYLIIIPMLIAKQHSAKMAIINQTHQVCYTGTIVGVTLALCQVGKFLFSNNLATFLSFLTSNNEQAAIPDITSVVLIFIANLIILSPFLEEIRQTEWYKKRYQSNQDGNWAESLDE